MKWRWVGDRGILVEFPRHELSLANASARALHSHLMRLNLTAVEDLVPAANSLLVVLRPGADPGSALQAILDAPRPPEEDPAACAQSRLHTLRVAYGGENGIDLAEVARLHGMRVEEAIALHSSVEYTVGFLGFTPGFGYLFGLPARLATPRLDVPRVRVPAGSVAIGGSFTGVYPAATPGGWRIIGRTDRVLFDPRRDPPALLRPGDRVRFVAV